MKESRLGGLRAKLCSGAELVDGLVESAEGVAERVGQVVGWVNEGGRTSRDEGV